MGRLMSLFSRSFICYFRHHKRSIYGLIGYCWSVVYLITRVLNFTTGGFLTVGGMLTWGIHAHGEWAIRFLGTAVAVDNHDRHAEIDHPHPFGST